MGNRAIITIDVKPKERNYLPRLGVYLHWNGGRDSVEAFLEYCRLKNYRSPEKDCYGWARFAQVISNFFGGSNSIGIDIVSRLPSGRYCDNGVYFIRNWKITKRLFEGYEQDEYSLTDMLIAIDKSQPVEEQLGEEFITAPYIETSKLKIGDEVFISVSGGSTYEKHKIVGFGNKGNVRNGRNIGGVPFVDLYENVDELGNTTFSWNINNYLLNKQYKSK